MKKVTMTTLALLLSLLSMWGQEESNYSPLFQLPPSPDAAALGKYGQYPVTLYNGLVNINVPFYTIELPMFSMPISFSYHPSGIKVNEISSVVGLGWSLNAGGVITRSVRGNPDSGFGSSQTVLSVDFIDNMLAGQDDLQVSRLYKAYQDEQTQSLDSESDVYYYNVAGLSGSFRFDTDGNLIHVPLSNNKIEYNRDRDIFTITGTDGTIYIFENREKSRNPNTHFVYTSSWYVSRIKTLDNKSIYFEYLEDNTFYPDYYKGSLLQINASLGGAPINVDYPTRTVWTTGTLLVKSIKFPGGSITLNYIGDRVDRRKYRLININLNNKNEIVKSFSLEHSYFDTNGVCSLSLVPGSYETNYSSRLKLDKVKIKGRKGEHISSYKFI